MSILRITNPLKTITAIKHVLQIVFGGFYEYIIFICNWKFFSEKTCAPTLELLLLFPGVGLRNADAPSFANIISREKTSEGVDATKKNEMVKKGKKPSRVLLSTAGGRRY